ncbi:MAG TPA: riboflavin synthase [Verrucomicrobiales bacterium]|nr:riboflavin synthase [Verrucomicrobiales bacterium]
MFTGLVEATGEVRFITRAARSIHLTVSATLPRPRPRVGESIAVNGCCLTVTRSKTSGRTTQLEFDLLKETWNRTNLSDLEPGRAINLERSLSVGDRLGGHFVTGHIDDTGTITRWERQGADYLLQVDVPLSLRRYLIAKGSIAVDGISLTVAAITQRGFRVWIIPHTHAVTALRERHVGDRVNLEADVLGKYVERLLKLR